MSGSVFFHIGLHKTATGWFQKQLFPQIATISVIRSRRFDQILPYICSSGPEKVVISHEGLSGTIRAGRKPGDGERRLRESLTTIAAKVPQGAIIVGFREHSAWLRSAYAQRAKKNSVQPDAYLESFSATELSWCHILHLIESSRLSVFPFLYEELQHDPRTLVDDLCGFLGVSTPDNVDALVKVRVNPSSRTAQGQFVSRALFSLAKFSSKLASAKTIKSDRLSRTLSHYGFRLGAWVDDFFPEAPTAQLRPPMAEMLREDWAKLLCLVS